MSDDCISRQAVLKIIDGWYDNNRDTENIEDLIILITYMASIKPQEPKTGHWILDVDREHGRCSECGCKEDLVDGHSSYKWCSNCGAKMVELQERIEKE